MIILQNKNKTIRPSYSVKFQPNKKQNIRGVLEHSVLPIISSVFGSVFPNMFLVLSITKLNPISYCMNHGEYNSSYIGPLRALQVLLGLRYRAFSGKTLGG